ncbi:MULTISPECIES: ABC transporter substrate-binding protein [unclassified Brevibacterium]|uniref:ABC transporter substrate-binding protein n=1 Tax=unclassified Brevibacterium TaxID=2614124 RepID=UPI0010F70EAC|nr:MULTISPECIES: ABC transporter substrate-binding protein [unclassified Brevibacterium]MCM1012003.1 ABC transporter substrate-binding protein [Brevibacterium sp. XM4083]
MKRFGLLAATLALGLVLTGCNANPELNDDSPGNTLGETQKGGTLNIFSEDPDIDFDPGKSQGLAITSLSLVHRRLTTWDIQPDKPGKVVPDLATDTGTVSDDGRTWTFTLKDGLKFENGDPITTADIKYGIERSFSTELSGGLSYHKGLIEGGDDYAGPFTGDDLESIETPDEKTIVFRLNSTFGDFPWIVSMPAFSPVPEGSDDPGTYGLDPVASGPYKVESNQSGAEAVLTRNDQWNEETDPVRTAGPDQVVFKLGQDASVTSQALISDSGDAKNGFSASFVPASQLAQVQNDPNAKSRLVTSGPGALSYLAMNNEREGLKDPKVRQAINYAVDKNTYRIAGGGEISGDYATTLITPGIPGRVDYDLYPAGPGGDVEKAKSLLAESGADLGTLRLLTKNSATDVAQAEAIQQALARVDITVEIRSVDTNTFSADATNDEGDYDLALTSWQPDYPSAFGNIQPLFDSSQIGGGNYNISRYSNPEVDDLIQQATETVDAAAAEKIWAEADKRIMEDAPIVPLTYNRNSFLHGSNVENFIIGEFPAYPVYFKASLKG